MRRCFFTAHTSILQKGHYKQSLRLQRVLNGATEIYGGAAPPGRVKDKSSCNEVLQINWILQSMFPRVDTGNLVNPWTAAPALPWKQNGSNTPQNRTAMTPGAGQQLKGLCVGTRETQKLLKQRQWQWKQSQGHGHPPSWPPHIHPGTSVSGVTKGLPVESSWSFVLLSKRLLVKIFNRSPPFFEPLSTWLFHSLNSSNGEQRRNLFH